MCAHDIVIVLLLSVGISNKKLNLIRSMVFDYDMNLPLILSTLVQVSSSYLIPSWSYERIKKLSMLFYFMEILANSNTLHGTEGSKNHENFVFP